MNLFIEEYSVINDSLIILSIKDEKPRAYYLITNVNNNRKRLQYVYSNSVSKSANFLLYLESEFIDMKSIDSISPVKVDSINKRFIIFLKEYFDSNPVNSDDIVIWEKFNELVMKEGYNPIGAEPILSKAFGSR